jgi:hypothetical protein
MDVVIPRSLGMIPLGILSYVYAIKLQMESSTWSGN